MVNTRSVRAGNSSQPLGRGQVPNNLPPQLPPPIPNMFSPVDHAEGGDENQPHNSAHNSISTANQDVVATQLTAMQQQFGVFQLVLAQLLARNNPGDPLINLLNPAPQPPAPQQNPEPVQHAPTHNESQGQSHVAPAQQPLHDDVTRRLNSLEKLVAEQRGVPPPYHTTNSIPHPLNTNITLEPYPAGFRIPQLETYDGTKDPDDHLHAFYSCMQAQNASNMLMCKIFPSTLQGNARTCRRLIKKTTFELMRVKQRDGESLKNYISRFNDTVLEVSSFDQAVGIAAVISGLKHDRFRDSLIKHPATTFSEVIDRSLKFITAEEYALAQNPTPSKNQNPDWRDENLSRKWMRIAQNRDPVSTSTPRFGRPNSAPPQQPAGRAPITWTPFNLPRSQSYNRAMQQSEGQQPQGLRNPPNKQGVGYQQAPPPLPPPAKIIHIITRGLEARGMSSKQRKLYVREVKHQNRAQKRKIDDADWKEQPTTFTPADFEGVVTPDNDPLVISVMINNCQVQHILVDTSSAPDIISSRRGPNHERCIWKRLNLYDPFHSVSGGQDAFLLQCCHWQANINRDPSCGLSISSLHEISNPHGHSNTQRQSGSSQTLLPHFGHEATEKQGPTSRNKDIEEVQIDDRDLTRKTQIGTRLSPEEKTELIAFLRTNKDVFAWTSADMSGILTSVSQHKLSTNPLKKPVAQKRRLFRGERLKVIKEEVEKLLQVGFVRRVDYCEWVANPVLVKKANGKWQMADVPMAFEDEEKTSFYAGDEIYCYVMMPFSLKNACATYQKMVTIVFRAQIGRNLEVYVDDIVVKSLKAGDHLTDLNETFNNLRKNRMRLNLAKCIFGVELGKFLGFMVPKRGIEVNPEKIKAVVEMEPPKSIKDVQRLTGRVAALHRYSIAEKAALAIVTSARKLRPYFQSHPIIVLMDQPLKQILQKPECSGRLIKWAVELGEFEITFQQRSAIQAQALTDFIVECTSAHSGSQSELDSWILYVDGASSHKGFGAGAILLGPDGYRSEHALKFNFDATNNMAEYEALLLGLQLVVKLKVAMIQIYSDSQLVVNQKFHLSKMPRAKNEQADSLSKFASDGNRSSRSVFVKILDEPSFSKPRMMEISTDPNTLSWTNPIISFLRDGTVPADKQEEMRLRKKASRYTLVNDVLYKRSFSLPLLRCLSPYEVEYALREVHEGVCGSHIGARTLAHKVLRQEYYWPNMCKDATKFVQRCQKCQFFAHLIHQAAKELTTLIAPWPFAQWGLDLLARPLSNLTSKKVKDFVFSSIICRYGIPNQIVADNGTQFNCSSFRDFCSSYEIKLRFTSVYHPKSNGMVESVNKVILEGIKPRLELHKAKWANELNNVLWAYKTMSQTTIGETPYHLAFGTEEVIPIEIGVPSFRVTHFDERRNGKLFQENLDLLDEVKEEARLRTLVYKQKIANFYNKRVRARTFKVGDLVLRKAGLTRFKTRFGKLAPN
ncbi:hypothetical protein SLEP1_g3175 [Rubroshorea leprosula]|uniref:Integrase catalytic domain-containing protein n=1 Tax=Rubroshorea leprosula TaxID=152421 RepID=A0AAV5HQK6_9ROSI|nr:hypothetical protein SLEP1_g3175 [Rubroshorea leprosula]